MGREYGITVNYIEKLDSFTAVIIDLPICLGELAAGMKIKCNLSFYLFKKTHFNPSVATTKGKRREQVSYLPVLILNTDDKKTKQEMIVQVFEKFTGHWH